MKSCKTCKTVKDVESFHKNSSYKDGRFHSCRECTNRAIRNNSSESFKRARSFRHKKARYGITTVLYEKLKTLQGNKCAICLSSASDRELDIDHDHATGAIRGLLCNFCNRGLGIFKDSSALLDRASIYLNEPPNSTLT